MATVRISTESISDWESFHSTCKDAFGFPDFYGMNMNAWIDCLSYLDEDLKMTRFNLSEGEMLHIELTDAEGFNARLPEIFDALVECGAFVNRRYAEDGKRPALSFVFL